MIAEHLLEMPREVLGIVLNLFYAVKLINDRVLPYVPATSNVVCEDGILRANRITSFFKGGDVELQNEEDKPERLISFLPEPAEP